MSTAREILLYILNIYFLLLIFRVVMEYVFMFARSWRPSGLWLIPLEFTYSLTDPPLKLLRRIIPPVRVRNVAFDMGFLVLFLIIIILRKVVGSL